MNQSFLIVGVARDCKRTLARSLESIYRFLPNGSSRTVFIVESDSTDDTAGILTSLKAKDRRIDFVSLGNLESQESDRIRRIAKCRNTYMEKLDKLLAAGQTIDFVVVADLDGVNSKVSLDEPIEELLSESKVICTNQRYRYYDVLALRKQGWVEEDYRMLITKEISSDQDPLIAYIQNVSNKQVKIHYSSPNISVESAFGGLAIYPARAVAGLRYSPEQLSPGIHECEHVSLNGLVKRRGFEMEITSSLRNSGSYRHTLLAFAPFKVMGLLAGFTRKLVFSFRT